MTLFTFQRDTPVASNGVAYLQQGAIPTSMVPTIIPRDGWLVGITVAVDTAAVQDYEVVVSKNDNHSLVAELAGGDDRVVANYLSMRVNTGDEISVRLERTSGSGRSGFSNAVVQIEYQPEDTVRVIACEEHGKVVNNFGEDICPLCQGSNE